MTIKNVRFRVEVATEDAKYLLWVAAYLTHGGEWHMLHKGVELALEKFKRESISKTEVRP